MVTKQNAGWFRPGDKRINRQGRALKREPTLAEKVEAWDRQGPCPVCDSVPRQPKSGRLMQVCVREELVRRGLSFDAPHMLTLPEDAKIVAVEPDAAGDGWIVIYRSEKFKVVQAGEPIPKLTWHYHGQMGARSW